MPENNGRSAKSRRAFHRVITGIKKDLRNLRFLTLTSSPTSPEDIQRSWHRLRARFDRRGLVAAYIRVQEKTKAGRKHLHVLFRGDYIDQAMLSSWWKEIHQAYIVDIRLVRFDRSPAKIAAYMAKYCSKENAGRLSWSWSWAWKGFCRDWAIYKRWWWKWIDIEGKTTFRNLLIGWDWIVQGKLIADFPAMLAQSRQEMAFDKKEFFPLRPSLAYTASQGRAQHAAEGCSALTAVIS